MERKRRLHALGDERGLLAAIVAASDDAIVTVGLDGEILSWSEASERLYGYSAGETAGMNVRKLVPPDRGPELEAITEQVLRGERVERLKTRRLRKEGNEIDVSVSLFPVRDSSGRIVAISSLARGIGELMAMEATLREREEQYRGIFRATSDGLTISKLDGTLVEVNPAFCLMHGYTREELLRLHPTQFIHADSQHLFGEYLDAVVQGGTFERRAVDVRKDGALIHVEVHGSLFTYLGSPHILGVVRDITRQVEAETQLEQQVAGRTHELTTLLDVSHQVSSTLEHASLVGLILDQLKGVVDYTRASIGIFYGSDLVIRDSRGPGGRELTAIGMRFPAKPGAEAIRERIRRRQAVLCADVRGETEVARAYRAMTADRLDAEHLRDVRSWLAVPLAVGDRVMGLLSLSSDRPGFYNERHARLALAIAGQVAIALENARLLEEAQEETRKTAALAEIGANVALSGSLETILNGLAASVVHATGAVAGAVLLIEGEPARERMVGAYGLDERLPAAFDLATRRGARTTGWRAIREGQPVVLEDTRAVVLSRREWEPIHEIVRRAGWDTFVALPLIAREKRLGSLAIFYGADEGPDEKARLFLTAVADQAAIAVDNARLIAEAQGKAALEERQRLARELHDSVSQALYGMALGARTARSLLDRDPARAAEPLDYVLSLAEAGLAEMRALIFELRPESLATEGLVAALGRQATLLRARHGIEVEVDLGEEPQAALDCKEALYRIAQEAVQNIVKHARANQVRLRLRADGDGVQLEIEDDGAGFDTGGQFPGHLGLRSMRERALQLGGSLEIDSTAGAGTRLRARVPASFETVEGGVADSA